MFRICLFLSILLPLAASAFKLSWQDDFNGQGLDGSKWDIINDCNFKDGNNELECYTNAPKNVRVANGNLVIEAVVEQKGNKKYTSARIHGKNGFKYGRFEVRAKLPKGKHLWPAIWQMPKQSKFGSWPRSGEIDIMEYRGQVPNKVEGTLHFGRSGGDKQSIGSKPKEFGFDFSQDYHVFGFERTPQKMKWFVDGKEYFSLDTSIGSQKFPDLYKGSQPWDEEFYWIFNLAVGGNFFNGMPQLNEEEAKKWPKRTMEVDWVKVYT